MTLRVIVPYINQGKLMAGMSEKQEVREVCLPADVVEKIEHRVDKTKFCTSSEYITYIIEEIIHQVEKTNDLTETDVDEQQVQDRLKSLGYLNE